MSGASGPPCGSATTACAGGGLAVRRLAWVPMHREVCNWAVWLWNERKEKVLANAVFRFLQRQRLNDESRIALARKKRGLRHLTWQRPALPGCAEGLQPSRRTR